MDLRAAWRAAFGDAGAGARLFRAPGRVNLIGEHTDYNQGWVLPVAISLATRLAARPRPDRRLRLASLQRGGRIEADLDALRPQGTWGDAALGTAAALAESGERLDGAEILVSSEMPLGAGLSSSAALAVGVGYALLALAGRAPAAEDRAGRWRLARAAERGEREYAGTQCGIMDQAVCSLARAGEALLLDCRDLTATGVPLPAAASLVVCATGVRHELASSEYNRRRRECERAAAALARRLGRAVGSLREVAGEEFRAAEGALPEPERRRARHVIGENERVRETVAALTAGDWDRVRELFAASQRSLREDYEVSCAELEAMVRAAAEAPGFLAGRMTGGGFGGATVNFVRRGMEAAFVAAAAAGYRRATGREAVVRVVASAAGVAAIRRP